MFVLYLTKLIELTHYIYNFIFRNEQKKSNHKNLIVKFNNANKFALYHSTMHI